MNQHIEPKFDETYITETLDNGLRVVVWHKPKMKTTACTFSTPYGALDFDLCSEGGKRFHHPSGIAHFLEHKMFEDEGQDIMAEFSRLGANVNAFTSYNETVYYFSTSSDEIVEPLNLLLNFVQKLSITDQSVEKEKGIITQELMMYMQMPDARLYFEVFKALYHEHPFKYDIGGSPESVANTTRTQLEECYNLNYHPANMLLVCVGPQDPATVLDMIRTNQEAKAFDPYVCCSRTTVKEPQTVAKTQLLIPMDITSSKVAVAIKLPVWTSNDQQRVHDEWAIRCALEAHFSAINPDYQTWIDEGLINMYFGYEIDLQQDAAFILFVNETEDREKFRQFVIHELQVCREKNLAIETMNQLKKRYFGQAMRILNNVEDIAVAVARNTFNGVSLFETLAILEKLDQEQIQEAMNHLCFDHVSLVAIVPQKQN